MLDYDLAIRQDEPAAITEQSNREQKAAYDRWEKANRLSLMLVKNTIHLSIRGAILDSDKVKEYLKSVEDHFKGSSKALASNLMLQMLTLKYDGSSGVREHIMKMTDMANKLKSLEMEVSDNFLVHFIMTSLPARFDTFKVNYNAMKDKWSTSDLISMCVQEEEHLKLAQPESIHLTTTANSKKRKGRSGNSGNKNANKVPKTNPGAVASSSNPLSDKLHCKFCRANGHTQKNCPKFKEWLAKKGIPNNPEATKGPKKA
uniref:uncharacterized protein LOC122590096 n=1 Tax=Erigeron canadensis TaxID=72917 RepID=UPI001CB9B7D9|nr:uncharacterized protein LOC122590096 [Erigeron canadensis]